MSAASAVQDAMSGLRRLGASNAVFGSHGSHVSEDGTYAMKKVLIQSKDQLDLEKEEIRVSSLFSHPNLLPLLGHAIIAVKYLDLLGRTPGKEQYGSSCIIILGQAEHDMASLPRLNAHKKFFW